MLAAVLHVLKEVETCTARTEQNGVAGLCYAVACADAVFHRVGVKDGDAETAEEISAVLKYCNEHNIAVTPRGAGTGLCGGCVAIHGGVVLSTEKMKKVLEVDVKNMTGNPLTEVDRMEVIMATYKADQDFQVQFKELQ